MESATQDDNVMARETETILQTGHLGYPLGGSAERQLKHQQTGWQLRQANFIKKDGLKPIKENNINKCLIELVE